MIKSKVKDLNKGKVKMDIETRMRAIANFLIDRFIEERQRHHYLQFTVDGVIINLDENENYGTPRQLPTSS